MTKKDYELIAGVLRGTRPYSFEEPGANFAWERVVFDLADALEEQNGAFDRDKFIQATGLTDRPWTVYEHDSCPCCKFLGQCLCKLYPESNAPDIYDLYACIPEKGYPTVIARYGNEPSEYASGLGWPCRCEPLREAAKRALRMGLFDNANLFDNQRKLLDQLAEEMKQDR